MTLIRPVSEQRVRSPRAIARLLGRAIAWPLGGLAAGVTWGAAARLWMRYVSTDPGFTWSGTLFIMAATGIAGGCLASVEGLRRHGRGGWRRLLAAPAVLMFAGPGALMLPTAVLGGLAVSGRGGRLVRYPAALLAVAPFSFFVIEDDEVPHSMALTLLAYSALTLVLAVAWSSVCRSGRGSPPS